MRGSGRHRTMAWSHRTLAAVPKGLVGVYAFWCRQTGKCVYVGKASERPIRDRLHDHWSGSHNKTLRLWIQEFGDQLDLCFAHVQRDKVALFERRLIHLWNPEANVQHKR